MQKRNDPGGVYRDQNDNPIDKDGNPIGIDENGDYVDGSGHPIQNPADTIEDQLQGKLDELEAKNIPNPAEEKGKSDRVIDEEWDAALEELDLEKEALQQQAEAVEYARAEDEPIGQPFDEFENGMNYEMPI